MSITEDIIESVLTIEEETDLEKIQARIETCKSCPHLNEQKMKCRICHCYINIKARLKKNRNPHRMGAIEVTHCILAKWPGDDITLVNHYRQKQGLNPIS